MVGLRYLSVCAGIEAASVAWHPLGWSPVAFSEIDAFPSALLARHYPDVPNYGDMLNFGKWPDATFDVLVGGTPCQSYSVAGLRGGLDDARGNLMLTYAAIARRYRPRWLAWENVPGVFSSNGGKDFACLLGILTGRAVECPSEGWGNSGIVPGIESAYGVAWRVLDAQYFGVPQRRRRVFVVGHLGNWRRAAAVLFERESLRGDPAPSRESGKGIAAGTHGGAVGSLCARDSKTVGNQFVNEGKVFAVPHIPDVAETLLGTDHKGPGHNRDHNFVPVANQRDEVRTMDVAGALAAEPGAKQQTYVATLAIRGRGADGSQLEIREDGTANAVLTPSGGRAGIGVGAVAYPIISDADRADSAAQTPSPDAEGRVRLRDPGIGIGDAGDPMFTLQATKPHALAFSGKSADDRPTLTAGAPTAVAFDARQSDVLQYGEKTGPIDTCGFSMGVHSAMQVRRLTPRECERLQGFPDDYTLIPYRGKPASDGPRYKALGNSMAVPVMRWIGERIAMVHAIPESVEVAA